MRVVLGFSNEATTSKIKYLLSTNEVEIFESFTSYKDLLEAYSTFDDLIIICQYKFKDGSILDIENKNSKNTYFICISNKLDEEFTKEINSFLLRTPVEVALFISLIKMILNINLLIESKEKADINYVDKAKEILIRDFFYSEESAHKFTQRLSMNLCVNKNYLCKIICNSFSS